MKILNVSCAALFLLFMLLFFSNMSFGGEKNGALMNCDGDCSVGSFVGNFNGTDNPAVSVSQGAKAQIDKFLFNLSISGRSFLFLALIVLIPLLFLFKKIKIKRKRYNSRIFISYRRCDSEYVVGKLRDSLKKQMNGLSVFVDTDSIPPGRDFRDEIESRIGTCDIFLAVIGKDWLSELHRKGESDYVRIEISQAFKINVPVIPILLNNVEVPRESSLPKDISKLTFNNFLKLRPDPDFENDVLRIKKQLLEHKLV